MMSIVQMAVREVLRRKASFLLVTACVAIAVTIMLGVSALLTTYRLRSDELLARKEAELEKRMQLLQDEMRKATLKLSFNLAILPGNQDIREWHEKDYATTYMPEEYVHRLADSGIVLVRHFLPILAQKVKWPEMNRTIILIGCRGEVPNLHKNPRAPLVQPVSAGSIVIGHELQQSLGLKVGQRTRLLGREYVIEKCHSERGSKDDISVWIPLKEAQELLQRPGLINAIFALECSCAGKTGVAKIRAEIAEYLPDTKAIEFGTQVLARNEAREKVKQRAINEFERESSNRKTLEAEREELASYLVPGVFAGCAVWIFLFTYANARGRRMEVAILRAIGFRANQILALFLLRCLTAGVLGTIVGCSVGLIVAVVVRGDFDAPLMGTSGLIPWSLTVVALIVGSTLGVVAGWIPALMAAQRDPAEILKEF